jgi:hypothetical protein
MNTKFALAQIGKTTNIFFDGKNITDGVEDLIYHARNEAGELCPTVEMRINIQEFSFDGGITFEQFVESVNSKRKTLSEVAEMADSKDTQGND